VQSRLLYANFDGMLHGQTIGYKVYRCVYGFSILPLMCWYGCRIFVMPAMLIWWTLKVQRSSDRVSCSIMQYRAESCSIMQFHAVSCSIMQYHAVSCSIMQYHAVSCSIMQYHAVSCSIMQYHAVSCSDEMFARDFVCASKCERDWMTVWTYVCV
jgi:hypothetical protein